MARPWGAYDSIDKGERYQVKRITVKPGAQLSLQYHHHRAEHWVVVRGTAKVTRDDETFLLRENESTYIPLGAVHRLENPGKTELELIEVQSGTYLGEDDIVRVEDIYGRHDQGPAKNKAPTAPGEAAHDDHRTKLARERAFVASPAPGLEERQPLQLVTRIRFQLLGGLLFAVLAPALFRWPDLSLITAQANASLQLAMLGSFLALVIGYWALRQVIAYPGVQATQYIFPTFAVVYAIVIVAFFFLRVDYSRYQFWASFVVAVVWFYACFFLGRRALRQRFGLVEAGETRSSDDDHRRSTGWR